MLWSRGSVTSHVKPRLGLYLVAHFAVKKLIPRFVLFSLIKTYFEVSPLNS